MHGSYGMFQYAEISSSKCQTLYGQSVYTKRTATG